MILVLGLVLVVSLIYLLYKYPYVQVVGESMLPTYKNGQLLKAKRLSKTETLTVGNVYVFKAPYNKVVIKRLNYIDSNRLFFIGDNIQCSFDSRSYGYIPRENVIAEIINP